MWCKQHRASMHRVTNLNAARFGLLLYTHKHKQLCISIHIRTYECMYVCVSNSWRLSVIVLIFSLWNMTGGWKWWLLFSQEHPGTVRGIWFRYGLNLNCWIQDWGFLSYQFGWTVWPGLDLSIIDFGLMNKILTLSVASLRWINIGLYKILPLIYIFSPNVWTEWLGSCLGPGFTTWLLCTGNFPILWTHTHAQTFFNLFHTLSKFLMCKAGWSNQKHRYCWFRVHHPLWFTHARGFSGK